MARPGRLKIPWAGDRSYTIWKPRTEGLLR